METQEVGQTIATLQRQAEAIREDELIRLRSRLAHLSCEDLHAIEAALCGTLNKLLHGPIIHLREAATSGNGSREVETVRAVFGLGDGAAHDGDRLE